MNNDRKNRKRIDLHTHSRLSDGFNTVEEIIRLAYQDGLRVLAITDHNLIAMTEKVTVGDGNNIMEVVPACEFSTTYYVPNRGEDIEVHVVGVWPHAVDPGEFDDIFELSRHGKFEYVQAILNKLRSLNIFISMDEVLKVQRKTGRLGRHQICEVLIQKGFAKTVDESMDKFVGNRSPYYVNSAKYVRYCDLETTIKRIVDTNGIPILAHSYDYRLSEEEIETLVKTFADISAGKGAIEVFYENYLDNLQRMHFLSKMAYRYRLIPSVASDRHRED